MAHQPHPVATAKHLEAGLATPVVALYHNAPNGDIQVGQWSAGLCGCFDSCIPNCCMVWCCPCVSMAQIAHRIGAASYIPVLLVFGVTFLVEIVTLTLFVAAPGLTQVDRILYHEAACLALLAALVMATRTWQLRTKICARFDIPGSCCLDCLVSFCCNCCALAQMATHVKSYTPGSCDFGRPDVLPAYHYNKEYKARSFCSMDRIGLNGTEYNGQGSR